MFKRLFFFSIPIMSFLLLLNSCNNGGSGGTTSTEDTTDVEPISKLQELTSFKTPIIDTTQMLGDESGCTLPTKISDFNSDWSIKYYRLTSDNSAQAQYLGFGANIAKKELVLIKEFTLSKDVECEGVTQPYGIGLRLFVHVKSLKKGGQITSIPQVAASVELNKAVASFELKGFGFALPQGTLNTVFNQNGENFDVDKFGSVTEGFNEIAKALNDNTQGLNIRAKKLPKDQ